MTAKIEQEFLQQFSDNTQEAYTYELARFFEFAGDKEPQEIDAMSVLDFRHQLSDNLKLKPASVNRALNTVRSYYEWLISEGKVNANPARKVKQARTDHANQMDVKWLSLVETERLYLAVSGEKDARKRLRDEAIISLMLLAGLRVSEVTDLEVADVNLAKGQGVITVREGKGDLWRSVPISDKLRKALVAWMESRGEYKFAHGSPYMFVSRKAARISRFTLDQIITKYMEQVGITEHSCHSLRHTFAKRLAESNVRLEEIAKLCGHASIQTTMIYTTPGAQELRDAVNRL
jgi:integrase/recombinase XerC